VNLRTTFRY